LVIADRSPHQDFPRVHASQVVLDDVMGIAIGFDAIPGHLCHSDEKLDHPIVLVEHANHNQEGVEVHASEQKEAVCLPQHAKRTALDVRASRHDHRPHDPALADAIVVGLVGLHVLTKHLVLRESGLHHAQHHQVVEEALVQPVPHRLDVGELAAGQCVPDGCLVRVGHSLHVRPEENVVVFVHEGGEMPGLDLFFLSEQSVPILDGRSGVLGGGAGGNQDLEGNVRPRHVLINHGHVVVV
jgi:hypothetical protein